MIGVLIIAHEDLGDSFIRCASHVVGETPPQIRCLGISIQDDPDIVTSEAQKLVCQLDCGKGVLILNDMCGATPCNVASRLISPGKVECLAGINLPMLVRVLTYRNESMSVLVEKALSGGKEGVLHIHSES